MTLHSATLEQTIYTMEYAQQESRFPPDRFEKIHGHLRNTSIDSYRVEVECEVTATTEDFENTVPYSPDYDTDGWEQIETIDPYSDVESDSDSEIPFNESEDSYIDEDFENSPDNYDDSYESQDWQGVMNPRKLASSGCNETWYGWRELDEVDRDTQKTTLERGEKPVELLGVADFVQQPDYRQVQELEKIIKLEFVDPNGQEVVCGIEAEEMGDFKIAGQKLRIGANRISARVLGDTVKSFKFSVLDIEHEVVCSE